MYPVSEAFLQAVQENTRTYDWSGKITTIAGAVYEFAEKDILKGSGYISAQCCGSNEMELGTVYSSEMGITLFLNVDRYTLENAVVELFYHLTLPDGTLEEVPMGMYEISEANRKIKCIEIKAYDYMLRFEKDFVNTTTSGTAYEILALCCETCGVELAQSQEEYLLMPNGSEFLSLYTDNDVETYRDVLYYIAQVLGGFFVINREGKLELRKYGAESVMEITQKQRFSSSFSDFITRYTAVSSTNIKTQMAEYYALENDDGLTMNLGINPFLQFGLEETREKLCRNILNDVAAINYVPFDSETIGNPALDLGDVLRFSGGHADETQITCITAWQCKIGGKQTLKCVGKNPRLAQAKSKNDKNITGLLNQIEEGKIGFFSFTNAKVFQFATEEIGVISIDFVAGEVTQAEFIGLVVMEVAAIAIQRESNAIGTITVPILSQPSVEDSTSGEATAVTDTTEETSAEATDVIVDVNLPVKWEEDGKAIVRAKYVLNGTEIEIFYPTETYGSGIHTFPLYYPVNNVQPNLLNNFTVLFSVEGGTVTINEGCCIATVTGQGLAAEATAPWDGTLEFEDTVSKFGMFRWMEVKKINETVVLPQSTPSTQVFGDALAKIGLAAFPMIIEGGGISE